MVKRWAVAQTAISTLLHSGAAVLYPSIVVASPRFSGLRSLVTWRGGSVDAPDPTYTVLSEPAPGSPFHYAFPVHDLEAAKAFYGNIMGCVEGRSSAKWQDYSLHGHQIVAHWVGHDYRCQDYFNPVDGDEVPVPRT
jgi:hypothetical protein